MENQVDSVILGDYTYKNETYEIPSDEMELYKEDMHSSVYLSVFQKKNGEQRPILVTLSRDLIEKLTGSAHEVEGDGLSEHAKQMKEADEANGYVNVFDVALKDFRKINRKKIYLFEKVADDSLSIEKSGDDVSLEYLIEKYGIRTTPTKTSTSTKTGEKTPRKPRNTKPKEPKLSFIDSVILSIGSEEEKAEIENNLKLAEEEYKTKRSEYEANKSKPKADKAPASKPVENVKPNSEQADKIIGLFSSEPTVPTAVEEAKEDKEVETTEKTDASSSVDALFKLD